MNPGLNKNRVIALAGILQAVELVHELAVYGNCNELAFKTSIQSLYNLNPENLEAVYGPLTGLRVGLAALERIFSQQNGILKKRSLSYFFGLLHLEKIIKRQHKLLNDLRTYISQVQKQMNFFQNITHPAILANLAEAYVKVIGSFHFRIMIYGNDHYLKQEDVVIKIRALLLAGLRSAILWRQYRGSRWQFIFFRNHYRNLVKDLLTAG